MDYYAFAFKQTISHTNIKFSPHNHHLLAVSSASNYGMVGPGRTQIKSIDGLFLKTICTIEQKIGIFDVSWCEYNDKMILMGYGNGKIVFWNLQKGKLYQLETQNQIQCVEFAYKNPLFLATNINGNLRIGNAELSKFFILLQSHKIKCYQAQWHPTSEKVFASGGGDGFLKLWDHTIPKLNIASIKAHENAQIMSIDFNKYEEIIATASTDNTIKLWDLRNMSKPTMIFKDHKYPVRKVKFSPHNACILATGSYDMNIHIYNIKDINMPLKMKHKQHTQFVAGIDFNLFNIDLISSVGWDGRILIWQYNKPQPRIQ